MNRASLSYSKVPKSSRLFLDYLYAYDRVSAFYNGSPFNPQTYARMGNELQAFPCPRKELSEILLAQNQAFGAGEETLKNIHRLGEAQSFAVVTGQQVGLFSGPAFTLYKALTAVRLADFLSSQGLQSVPVFWLATEDHDLEEVSHVSVFDDGYERIDLTDPGERPALHSPVGRVKLTNKITEEIDRLESVLPAGDSRSRLIDDLRATYQPGATWGRAFGCFLARLFARWGVILLDPLDEAIHRLSIPVYEEALGRASELQANLQERSHALVKAGYHAQVHVTDQSTLVFAEREGNRVPIHHNGASSEAHFSVGDSETVPLDSLISEIHNHPLGFSANVLLRPLVQDFLLPTVAYVAGPSELAYLGQASVLYTAYRRPMPAIFPRAAFTLVEHRVERWLEKYQLQLEDVWEGEDHLRQRIAATAFAAGWEERFSQAEGDLAALLERLRKDIQILDPTLLDNLKHVEEKIVYQVVRLKGKLTRAALNRTEVLARQAQSLRRALMPEKELQERAISGVYFLGRAGYELLDRLFSEISTDSSDHHILNL